MMLITPTAYRVPKSILMIIICLALVFQIFQSGRLAIHKDILVIFILNIATGLFFVIYGLLNSAPGAMAVSTVYVIWPILYGIFVSGIRSVKVVDGLLKTLIYSSYLIGTYSIIYILTVAGYFPYTFLMDLDMGQRYVVLGRANMLQYRIFALQTIGYVTPFIIAAIFSWRNLSHPLVSKKKLLIGLLFCLIAIAFSGRRALMILVLISPLITLTFMGGLKFTYKRTFKPLIIVIFSLTFLCLVNNSIQIINVQEYWELILSAFDTDTDYGAQWRQYSGMALIKDWSSKPLLGYGLGAVGSLPGGGVPWAYELTYLSLLFHTGLIGIFVYSYSVSWIFWKGLIIIRSKDELRYYVTPLLSGTLGFLLINMSNPYLEKYDYLWAIFLPLSVINVWFLSHENNSRGYYPDGT